MRAGPLSNDQVIDLLNHDYVPVFTSNEDYEKDGPAPPVERKERQRIIADCARNGTSTGTVHVYLVGPDGRALDSMHVAKASKTENLLAMLQKWTKSLGTQPGEPMVKPRDTSVPPAAPAGSIVLHLVSRGQDTGPRGGSWRECPSENWIVLSAEQAHGFLPKRTAEAGATFDVDADDAAQVLRYFYPQSEDPTDNPWTQIDRQSLTGTVISIQNGLATARLEGSVQLQRNFYPHKFSPERMNATLLGFIQWRIGSGRITRFNLVTDEATTNEEHYAVAVRMER